MPSTQLNCDIWYEVLELLRHELFHDPSPRYSYYEFRLCRKTILSIALTSTTLANIALSALWRDMNALTSIVPVINACAVDGPFLYRQTIASKGIWVLREPPYKNVVCDRVWSYLRRIRSFSINGPPDEEVALWTILSRLLDSSTLLPNLRCLTVNFGAYRTPSYDHHLMLLVPPTLDTFQTSQPVNANCVESVLALYQRLAARRVALRSISYHGASSPGLFPALSFFRTLRDLSVTHEKTAAKQNKMSILELTQKLPNLSSLQVDLRTISLVEHTPTISVDHYSLKEMTLDAFPGNLEVFFRSGLQCPCLESLNIRIHTAKGLSWRVLNQVASTFPRLEALCIEVPESVEAYPSLRIQDLEVFLPRRMTKLRFAHVPYDLPSSDLMTMVKAWPDLRSLTLSGSGVFYDLPVLTVISQLHHLEYLRIRIDCMTLINVHSCPPVLRPRNTLQEICLVSPTWTSTLEVAEMLARRLRWLFPKLNVVDAEGAVVSDLDHILKGLDYADVITQDVVISVE